ALAAQDGEDPVAGELVEWLREVEVVPVLRPFCFLPIDDADLGDASVEELLADFANQVRIRGDSLDDDGACPGQCCFGVFESLAEVALGDARRVLGDPGRQQRVCEWLQPGIPSDGGLSLAALLIWQVEVLEA